MVTKHLRQKQALTKWKDNAYRGVLNLTMRFGKTMCAKKAITHFHRGISTDIKTVCIAPNTVTKENLKTVCGDMPNITYHTVASFANKYKDLSEDDKYKLLDDIDFLIVDEVHKLISDTESNVYVKLAIKVVPKVLALTGSVFSKHQIQELHKCNIPIVDSISEQEAIENGWIVDYQEVNIAIQLEESEKSKYANATEFITNTLKAFRGLHRDVNNKLRANIFDSEFSLIMACFLGKAYVVNYQKGFIKNEVLCNLIADLKGWRQGLDLNNSYNRMVESNWNPSAIKNIGRNFKSIIKARNDLMINNRGKLNAVIALLEFNPVPSIVFNESTDMADMEYEYFNKDGIIYHSAVESRPIINPETGQYYTTKAGVIKNIGKVGLRKLAIEGIKNGTYKFLFTAKALNEGVNIENISQVIITAGDLNTQTHLQRSARGKTVDPSNFNKKCIVINLYIDDFVINGELVNSRDRIKLSVRQAHSKNVQYFDNVDDFITHVLQNQ